MHYSIDRIDNGIAVLIDENNKSLRIGVDQLPPNVSEGQMLVYADGVYTIDLKATEDRQKEVNDLLDSLFK